MITTRLLRIAREAMAARLQSDSDIVTYGSTVYHVDGTVRVYPEITRGDIALEQLARIGH